MARFTWIAVLASLVACSGGGSSPPADVPLAGDWAYVMSWQPTETTIGLTCAGEMHLEGENASVTGVWQDIDCGEHPEYEGSGTLTGWASDGHFEIVFLWHYLGEDSQWHDAVNRAAGSLQARSLTGTFAGAPGDTLTAQRVP